MKRLSIILFASLAAGSVGLVNDAHAQYDDPADQNSDGPNVDGDRADEELGDEDGDDVRDPEVDPLPAAKSDDDAAPPVARPAMNSGGLVKQAGIGGQTAYGRPGVMELGGSAGFAMASGFTQVDVSPTVGYFLTDNLEVSGMLGLAYVEANDESATLFRLLAEPSYHLPFDNRMFGFLGLGAGVAHVEGLGAGFALAPRVGANFLVGRSGVLTPALSYQYTTHNSEAVSEDMMLLQVSSQVVANVGYTVMW